MASETTKRQIQPQAVYRGVWITELCSVVVRLLAVFVVLLLLVRGFAEVARLVVLALV